jgi:hypothetical protein
VNSHILSNLNELFKMRINIDGIGATKRCHQSAEARDHVVAGFNPQMRPSRRARGGVIAAREVVRHACYRGDRVTAAKRDKIPVPGPGAG